MRLQSLDICYRNTKKMTKPIYNYKYKTRNTTEEEEGQEHSKGMGALLLGSLFSKMGKPEEDETKGKANHIYFYDEIDRDCMLELAKKIRNTALELQKLCLRYDLQEKPKIYLHISSFGGCIFSCFTVIDAILQSEIPVVTIVEGACASAATLISVAGHERWIGEYGYFLMHQLRSGNWGSMNQLDDAHDNCLELMRRIKAHYVRFSNGAVKESQLDDILKHDIFWTAKDCMESGLVDKIITGDINEIGNCVNANKQGPKRRKRGLNN